MKTGAVGGCKTAAGQDGRRRKAYQQKQLEKELFKHALSHGWDCMRFVGLAVTSSASHPRFHPYYVFKKKKGKTKTSKQSTMVTIIISTSTSE